ncbi:MAG: ABC transporter ATP-binding protein [Acidimicrobiia bacterium]
MSDTAWGLEDALVCYGQTPALEEVDVEVKHGEITAVVGGDGAGKSTVARAMVGLVDLESGQVRRPDTRHIGYQSESSGVWSDLTVIENLDFVASAHRLTGPDRSRRINAMLEVTRLGSARDRLAADLSGGMRQKLGVAMALLPEPALLVLDEPTTGLDPVSRTELWSVVARSAVEGAAVLTTTTYLDEAERGSEVVALEQGRVLARGTLDEVRTQMPGVVAAIADGSEHPYKWRRGGGWRAWFPNGEVPPGTTPIDPDLTDLITVAAFARRLEVDS